MSRNLPLYHKALLAWQRELERQHREALEDKRTTLRDGFLNKLSEMFGPDHGIEMVDNLNETVQRAVIEDLNFLAFRTPPGNIHIVLLVPCPRCGHQMPSGALTRLADLGRELLQLETSGALSNHECPASSRTSQ